MRIALFEPDIPQNAGNIFRLGACLGIPIDIIEPMGFIIDDKRLKRASMDYYDYLDLTKHISWDRFYIWSKDNSYRLVLLTTKGKKSYLKYKFRNNDILSSKGSNKKIVSKLKWNPKNKVNDIIHKISNNIYD